MLILLLKSSYKNTMKIEMSTGKYRVVLSGVVFLYDATSKLSMKIDTENDKNFSFEIILEFTTDETNKKRVQKDVEGNTIYFTCFNFSESLGTGTTEPIPVATVSGKELVLHFWSYTSDEMRKVEYTFLMEE